MILCSVDFIQKNECFIAFSLSAEKTPNLGRGYIFSPTGIIVFFPGHFHFFQAIDYMSAEEYDKCLPVLVDFVEDQLGWVDGENIIPQILDFLAIGPFEWSDPEQVILFL